MFKKLNKSKRKVLKILIFNVAVLLFAVLTTFVIQLIVQALSNLNQWIVSVIAVEIVLILAALFAKILSKFM